MPTVDPAFRFLEENARELFGTPASMLYVGHRGDTHPWWRTAFAAALSCSALDVIDIDRGNLGTAPFARRGIHGDIRTADVRGYGLVFWDEGPEHVPRQDALDTILSLSERNEHVLVSCPWGYQPQGSGPSDYEFHHWGPMPADFAEIGLQVRVFGTMFDGAGGGHGNLLAWI